MHNLFLSCLNTGIWANVKWFISRGSLSNEYKILLIDSLNEKTVVISEGIIKQKNR